MTDPAATLKSDDPNNANQLTEVSQSPAPPANRPMEAQRVRKMKFAYQSGSQPLSGYTIKRGIGIGGFGEVYFALSDAGKEVALKCIQRNLDIELRGVRQCLNLKHMNLIRLWDICTNDAGESWVVMEYVPGESLRDVVEANPSGMSIDEVHRWFLSVASGVAYLHSRGIVHRDLKPGNIFFDQDEQIIKIGDYGLSKFISCSRRSGQTESVGTFHYMAPEIGKGVYGKEIDVYALGIILFEMLTGNIPFDGESSQEIIMKHLTADPDVNGIAEPYASIISKAMRKDPELRYRNVQDMLSDFPAVGALPDRVGPVPPVPVSQHPQSGDEQVKTENKASSEAPPIQPMFIDDTDIVFGEVQDVVPAEKIGNAVEFTDTTLKSDGQGQIQANVERVEVIAADQGMTIPDEPIARAVVSGWERFRNWWFGGTLNSAVKVVLFILAALIVLKNREWLLPTALFIGLLYLAYYAIRTWTLKPKKPKKSKQKVKPTKEVKPTVNRREQTKQTNLLMRQSLAGRPVADRVTELLGSMLVAAISCLILGTVGFAFTSIGEARDISFLSVIGCSVAVSVFASWAILVAGKCFEGTEGEQLPRRFAMLAIGLLTAVIAIFVVGRMELGMEMTPVVQSESAQLPFIEDRLYLQSNNQSTWAAYIIAFAGLFAALRWWRQVDPIRKTRVSIFSIGICVVCGIVFAAIFGLNLAWMGVIAGLTAVSVQLASPWIHPKNRESWLAEQNQLDDKHATNVAT